jgi:hypothetical protein
VGSGNYSKEDITTLFDIIGKELPIGQKGWKIMQKWFNTYTRLNGHPMYAGNTFENKYKQV